MSKSGTKRSVVLDEPTRLVCAGLALAVVFTALRIANVWP
jgi:hypothetical protein